MSGFSHLRLWVALAALLAAGSALHAADLDARIAPLVKAHKGKAAVAVRHLTTGEEFYLGADEVMPTASLIKLPIMVETYWQVAEGKVKLDTMLTLRKEDKVPGSGILTTHFSDGVTLPLRDAVRLMIAYSDNTATNLVLDQIGIPSTTAGMKQLGLKNTRLNSKVFRGSTTVDPEWSKKYGLGSTTAREMVELLALIEAGKVVSPAACKEMIAHLKTCDTADGLQRYLPARVAIAHKSGAVNEARTEAGILYLPSGPVAVCVLTAQNEDKRWTSENAGRVLAAKVAREVVEYFASKSAAKPSPPPIDQKRLGEIDAAVCRATERGDCPGVVAVVVHGGKVVYRKAFGLRAKVPESVPMTVDTVFDLASLTKPVATATVVAQLAERGKLKFTDPVAKYWPEFGGNGKEGVTLQHCLLHVSGLIADNPVDDYEGGRAKALGRVAALKLEAPPGSRFKYSDVGFIVLGEVVERVSGKPLDVYVRDNVFVPLRMTDAGYKPTGSVLERVAPTGKRAGEVIRGAVHDPRANLLGGVAGHAGLFATADDLARFCRMLLGGGELDGVRVLSADSVKQLTTPVEVPAAPDGKPTGRKLLRSRGWDVDTAYSAPRGEGFAPGTGFGHTGFTGTSIWIDPPTQTAVILLTNRVHPDDRGNVVALRRQVATLVAEAVKAGRPLP